MTTTPTSGAADLPEALRLAAAISNLLCSNEAAARTLAAAADELVRLHAESEMRRAALLDEMQKAALAAGQAMWRHIETAPKDGSYLLLWEQYSDAPFVGYWSGGSWSVSHEHVDAEGGWDGANVVDALSMPITHWMPLPPAPGPADGESNV